MWRLAANPFNITANQIGLPQSTPTIGAGLGNALAAVTGLVGGLALIFIVVGGIQMVLSAGDSKRVAQARNTILYAAVGVLVSVAGYAIILFVAGASLGGH